MKQKIFTLFAALLLAGSMSAVTINAKRAIAAMSERDGYSMWEFGLFDTEAMDDYPYLAIGTFRTSDDIAGTHTVVNEWYVIYVLSIDDFIVPSQYSELVVTRVQSGLYNYSFTFTGHNANYLSEDVEYVVNLELPTEIHNLAGEIIEAAYIPEPTDVEDIPADSYKPVKVIHDGQIYILRAKKTYTLTGQEVR